MAIALQPNSVYAYTNLDEVQVFLSTVNLTDRGDWSSATTYAVGNVITYLDALYYCVAANTNEAPSGNLSDYWSSLVLVRQGSGSSSVTAAEAYALAQQAYTVAINGTVLIDVLDDRLDAEIQARLHGDGTTFWNGTAYADSLFASVSPQAGSNYAYSLYVAGTNYTNTQISSVDTSAGSNYAFNLYQSGTNYTDQQIAAAISAVQSPDYGNRLISGGRVVWLEDYDFRVAPSVVSFAGTAVTFAGTDVTLSTPDATLDRIDLIVADHTYGTIAVIEGDPSTPPAPPNYDPVDQFQITFIPVSPSTTQPTSVIREWIYRENVEWTTSDSGATINPDSTSNPFQGLKDVEGTNTIQNNFVRFQSPTALEVTDYDIVYLYVRPKASWGTSRSFRFNWETASGVRIGDYFTLRNGVLGWQSALLEYQLVAIPISMFNILAGQDVRALRITQIGSGTAPGFYLDDIALQAGITQPSDVDLPLATTTQYGIVQLAQNGEAASNVVVQGNDYRLALGAAGTAAALTVAQQGSLYTHQQFVAGTNYTNAQIAAVTVNNSGSAYAFGLYTTGTNYTNQRDLVVAQQGSNYSFGLYVAGTNYAQSLVGSPGDHVIAGQNVVVTDVGAGTRSVAINRITTNTVDWVGPSVGAVANQTYAGTVTIDFGTSAYRTISLTGDLHMLFTNMSAGRGVSVRLLADSTLRSLTFDGNVRFLGTYPTEIEANKVGVASFCAYGANASDIVGVFASEA
jgi:hypothetical protein